MVNDYQFDTHDPIVHIFYSPGTDITLVAHSRSVGLCLEVAEELKNSDGVSCEVWS